jgi:hypothetical protein
MATPSLAMIPSAYADSKVYSVLPNNGDGDFTFNRDSSATRVGQNGLIQEVGYFGNNLVTNGDFSNGSTDWGLGSNWSVANGKASCDGSASNSMSQASTVGIASTTFKVSYDVLSISQGSIRITLGGVAGSSVSQVGSYSDFITATSTDRLRIFADSSAIASIDNIIVQQVTGDQPRLNYDISNGVVQSCPSLLLEPASTNLIIQSNQFSTSWAASGVTLQDNQSGVSGGLNAWKITEDTSTSQHSIQLASSLTAATEQTVTIYAKAAERNYLMLNQSGVFRTFYDLVNGTVVSSGTGVTASMESMPNGWWRCVYTATMSFTALRVCVNNDGSSSTYTGDGVSGIYIQYCQNESLSYATSYIPTNGASQTRAAETCNDAGTASTFNDSEGVLYAEITALANDGTFRNISLNNDTSAQAIRIYYRSQDNKITVLVAFTGGNQSVTVDVPNSINFIKIAVKYIVNNVQIYVNGSVAGTITSVAMPTGLNQLDFSIDQSLPFYGKCKDIRVYNEALTDAQLQTLTTL